MSLFVKKIRRIKPRLLPFLHYLFAHPLSLRAIICRIGGHSCGVVWYNPGGTQPNMCCRNCGDDLG